MVDTERVADPDALLAQLGTVEAVDNETGMVTPGVIYLWTGADGR